MNYKYAFLLNKQIKYYTTPNTRKNISIMYKTQHILITTIFFQLDLLNTWNENEYLSSLLLGSSNSRADSETTL